LKVYVLTGMPGAGKEEFVKVAMEVGFDFVRMGDVVRDEGQKRGIDESNIGGFAHTERQIHGMDVWARRTVPYVKEGMLIDGCRGLSEIKVFQREIGEGVRTIAVHTSPGERFRRLVERQRADAPEDWDEFLERDNRELGWGLGKVISTADIMIVNEGDLQEFRGKVRSLLERLRRDEI
jgi:dephospho-CoA kinase